MKKEVLEVEVKTGQSEANIKDVVDAIKDLNQNIVSGNKKTEDSLKGVEQQSKKTRNILGGITKLFKAALGIGIVVQAFQLLKDTFMANQKVADVFSNVMETVSIVFNQVVDAVVKGNGEFNALGKVLSGLVTIGLTPIKLGFYGIKLGLQQAQLAWEDSFFGGKDKDKIKQLQADIQETKDNLSGVANEAVDAGKDIYNNFSDAVDGISNISIKAAYEQAQLNTQLEKNAKLATVANQGLIEQYDREAELLRQLRDDTSKSIEERIKANEDLGLVLEKQQAAMQENAKTIVLAAQAQYQKNKNDENAVALQEALNEQAAIDAQITGFKSEQQTNLNSLLQEQKDIQNELALIGKSELETAKIEAEQKLQTQIDLITREVENEEERNALLLEAKRVYEEEIKAIDDEVALKAEENRQIEIQAKKDALAKEAELEKEKVQMKVDALNAIMSITNSETALGKAAFIAKQLLAGKEMLAEAKNTLGRISLRASEATVSTAAGAANTAKVGFPQNIPLLIGYAAQAVGIIGAIKSAVSTAKGSIGAAGAGGSIPNIQAPRIGGAASPSFNVVGQSGTNQLAESIGSQQKQPIKAYVVSGDVTSAQSMERNIVESASI
jgi:hypothetical protein